MMKNLGPLLLQLKGARAVGDLGALSAHIERVHTDSRSLLPGDLFVAIKGETFDAHHFLPQAKAAGAVAAIAHGGLAQAQLAGVEVQDTLAALGELSRLWRGQWTLPLIAVTGSNGKTTVTQMIASVLRAAVGQAALATQGNLNNHIGVPLTLLRLRESHRLAVVELGMNHPGEIAYIANLAMPTVALVNNAQREHQEFMASVEAVARENGTVLEALSDTGVAVFPSDDEHTPHWRELAGARRQFTFSDSDGGADVRALSAVWADGAWSVRVSTPVGECAISLRIAGRHNVRNALACVACALAAGVSLANIADGLNAFEPVGGRSRALALVGPQGPITLIDDTYNANPDSVVAAIRVLAELPAPRLLVLGDMGEVGEQGLAFHQEVLAQAKSAGIDTVHVAGDWMLQAVQSGCVGPRHWADVDALAAHVSNTLGAHSSLLVKGSRFMRMERVVKAVQAQTAVKPHSEKDPSHVA